MANSGGYNLTVQLNLQGPSNVNQVVNNINKQLGNIQANVNLNLPSNVARQLANINKQMQQTSRAASEATSGMEKFGRAAGFAIKRFGAFTTATAGFYAITRATQQSLEKFVEFDKQITRIAQVTNTTKQSLSGLSAEITKLATSLGASSSELAQVSVTLSQAGLSARETEKALKALALTTLAPTFNNLNQTVEGSIALMKQFSISTSQLESALGSINAVAGSFAVEASDLITAVQRAGGVFAAASQGVSTGTDALNEFLAVFTSVRSTTRESAETIATGLRTIFTRLQREDTIAALQAFGVQLTDLEGKFVGPYKAVEQLAKGLGRLDPRSLEFSGIVEELGGFRQVGKVIPLIQRFTTAQQALNVAQQGSGSLAKGAAIGQQSLAVQISIVKEEFDALIRSIGQTSEFKQFIRLSLDLASALIQVADAIKPVLPAIAALGAIRIAGGIGSFARGVRGSFAGGARGFNSGGLVPGSGNTDTVRANLTPGEYVIRKKAVEAIGVSNLEKMNKYAEGGSVLSKGPVEATGAELSKTYGSLRSKVDPEQLYTANVNPIPVETDKIIRGMKARKAKKPYMYPWQNFELSVAKTYRMKSAGGQSFLDFPQQLAEAKFLPPGAVYSRDKETGFLKGNNNETMLAKLVGSGLYSPGETVSVFYPEKHSEVLSRLQTQKEKQEKAAKTKTTKKNKATTATPIRKRNANGGPVQKFGRGGRTMAARDADFDEKFEGLVRDFETAPLGKRLSALRKATSAFQDYSIREMMFAQPQLQSVGPNITPALMLEGLRSGKIGYSTGIDPKFPKRTPVFFGEKLSRLTSARKSGSTDRTTDARTHKNFLKLLGIPEDQIKGISTKALDKIISRSFRNTKKGVESKVAAYAGLSNFKPALIKYGKGQGTFGDVVKGFDKQIRDALANDSKLLSHYNGMLSAGTWSNYLATGGKAGHLPALKKKLYSIVGVTERNLGGPIERLGKGVASEDTVPALLTPGEYVINARAASVIGEQKLNALNNADRIGYNRGGRVRLKDGRSPAPSSNAIASEALGESPRQQQSGIPGGSFTFLFGLQAAASGLQAAFDETTESGAQSAGAIQGFTTGLTSSIVGFELLETLGSSIPKVGAVLSKLGGPAGMAAAGLIAVGSAVVGYLNAQKELEKKLSQEKFTSSLDAASTALEDAANGTQGAIQTFNSNMISAAQAAEQLRDSQNQYRYSLIGSPLDFLAGLAGADEQTNITRSRILQEQGTLAYLGSFVGDAVKENQEAFSERDRAAAAKEAENIAKMQIQRGSQIIDKGGSLRDVANAIGPEVREAMARSNVEVAKVLDQTADPKQRERIINQEVGRQLTQSLGPLIQEREARAAENAANQAAQQLQVALNRVFDAMKQNFAAVATNIESRFDQVADSLAASLGQGKFQYSSNQLKTILNNTKAFSDDQVRGAIASTMPLLGDKGGRIGDLALASTRIEGQIGNIIDNVLLNANVAEGAKLSTIGTEFTKLISGLNLGSDIEKVINDQLKKAFEQAQKDLGDNARPGEIRQRVQEIVENIPSLNGALDVVKEAMETFSAAQNRYSQAVQQVTEAVLKQQEYLNRASSIRREGALELRRATGQEVGLRDIIANTFSELRNITGGSTDIQELFRQQRTLLAERERVTGRLSDISGMADANDEFITLRNRLADLDVQLTRNRNGLEFLASNTEIAGAALREFSNIQSKARDQLSYAEKLVTASPEELYGMRFDFQALQNIMDGGNLNLMNSYQAQREMMRAYGEGANLYEVQMAGQQGLAGQRASMLSMMKELQPFFGDNKQFQEAYGNVMKSFLQSTGMYNQNWEKAIQQSLGRGDDQQKALMVYRTAIDVQSRANEALAFLPQPMHALTNATLVLNNSIRELSARMNTIGGMAPNPPQRKASGGVIYASNGQLVNMEPRGTDTVPAMLTPGEFVVNARSTKKHRRLLEQINGNSNAALRDGVTYAAGGVMIGGPMFGMPSMSLAEERYMAYLRWYQENYGMGAQRLITIQARNMIRGQVQQDLMMEGQQQQQRAAYNQWLGTAAGEDFITRRNNLEWDIMNKYPIGSTLYNREKARIQNLSPQQVLLEERRIQKQKEKAEIKQKVVERRRKEREEAEEARLRKAAGGDEQRYQDLRSFVEGEPPQRPKPTQPTTKTEEDWTPFDNNVGAVVRRYNRDGTVTITNISTGESQTIGTPRVNTFSRPDRQASPSAQPAQTQKINTVGLEERANRLENGSQATIEIIQTGRDNAYGAHGSYGAYLGAGMLWAADQASVGISNLGSWMFGTQTYRGGRAIYDDQIKREKAKLERIKEARRHLQLANSPELSLKERREHYQIAHRMLYGAGLNAPTFAGGATEEEYAFQQDNIGYNQMAAEGVVSLATGPVIRGGGAVLGAVRRGSGAAVTRGSEAIVRRGAGALAKEGAEATTTTGAKISTTAGRTGTTAATEAATETAERAAAQAAAEAEAKAAGTTLSRLGREGTHRAGGSTVSFNTSNLPPGAYRYQAGEMTLEQAARLERAGAPFAEGYMEGLRQLGNPYLRGVGPSGQGGNYFNTIDSIGFYNRGGIVQPAYLSGGGGAWQFDDLREGRWTYEAINTDPLAWKAYDQSTRYSSPREHMSDNIRYGLTGLGFGSYAASMGLGLDASRKLVLGSPLAFAAGPREFVSGIGDIFGEDNPINPYKHTNAYFSRGGVVQPSYLYDGGYMAINTDPLAYQQYNPLTRYSSSRERSADRINYGYSGLGMGSFAASKGLGLDAAGRPVFESRFGYSDPRSDERDFQTIFGYNRYPSFLAGGGLAKGTDKYPAMLSRGEMVMNAEATRRNEGILRAMNKSSGGIVNNGILYAANGTDGPIGMAGSGGGFGGGGVLGGALELSQSMNAFVNVSQLVVGSFNNLINSLALFASTDFGVLNEGASSMLTASSIFRSAAISLGTPLNNFGQSVQGFVSQTSNLISAISKIGDVNGTINVVGRIDVSPIQVDVIGTEILETIIPDIENRIITKVALGLANDNPGINVTSLAVS